MEVENQDQEDLGFLDNGKYHLIKEIGKGPTSHIYLIKKVQQEVSGQDYQVLKAVKRNLMIEELEEIFLNEVEYLKLLKGKSGVIDIFDSYLTTTIQKGNTYKNIHAMILEFAKLGSLRDFMGKLGRPFYENELLYFLKQMAEIIKQVHQENIFQADIKIDNFVIMDSSQLQLKIIDFGISRPNSPESTFYQGTLHYLCPQQIALTPFDGFKADIFALGTSILVLMKNDYPWHKVTMSENVYRHAFNQQPELFWQELKLQFQYSDQLKQIVFSMIQFQPENRPTLEQILANEIISSININSFSQEQRKLYDQIQEQRFSNLGIK